MGSGSSKPAATQHVFTSDPPVRFSPEIVDALQASPETDSTRATDLELHIQRRVADELKRLEAATNTQLHDLTSTLSNPTPHPSDPSENPTAPTEPYFTDSASQRGGPDQKAQHEADRLKDLSRASVQKEIDGLKEKLRGRQMREEDAGVKRAKGEVVRCLRTNDRRPLDCWREVEGFKREVGRLEMGFLGKTLE